MFPFQVYAYLCIYIYALFIYTYIFIYVECSILAQLIPSLKLTVRPCKMGRAPKRKRTYSNNFHFQGLCLDVPGS